MVTDDRSGLSDYLAAFCDTGAVAPDDSLHYVESLAGASLNRSLGRR